MRVLPIGMVLLALSVGHGSALHAQRVREIRLSADPEREEYRFQPATISVSPGDVLLFTVTSGAPHSVIFESGGLSRHAHEALNEALPRRAGDLSSPLLAENGAEYRVVVPDLAPGTYRYFCLPHRAYDMRGELVLK